jgi:hypothetical protein
MGDELNMMEQGNRLSQQPKHIHLVGTIRAPVPLMVRAGWWVVVGMLAAGAQAKPGPTSRPFAGVTYADEVRQNPPLHLYWVQADFSNPRVHLRLCAGGPVGERPWETTLLPVSKIAAREGLDVAVNGSFFAARDFVMILGRRDPYFEGNAARACGWTVSDGRLWSATPLGVKFPSLLVARDGHVSIGMLPKPPVDAAQMVSGCNLLLQDGRNVGPEDARAPRCAVGLDATNQILTLLVVDGRRPESSAGLSMHQTAEELLRLGCKQGLILDSGGSATLVIRQGNQWPVVNLPSDGHDLLLPLAVARPVANALGIVVDK